MPKIDPAIILFALVAGYASIWASNRAKLRSVLLPWERVLFEAAIRGLALFAAVRVLILAAGTSSWVAIPLEWARGIILHAIPFPFAPSWVAATLAGVLLSWARNTKHQVPNRRFYSQWDTSAATEKAIDEYGGELLRLLWTAAQHRLLVSITLESRKFYVGYIHVLPNLTDGCKYTRIYPSFSGYRHSEDLTFRPTTAYDDALKDLRAKIATGQRGAMPLDGLGVVVPVEKIVSAYLFDQEIYDKHFRPLEAGASATVDTGSH